MDYATLIYRYDGKNNFQQLPYSPLERNVYQLLNTESEAATQSAITLGSYEKWSNELEGSALWKGIDHAPFNKTSPVTDAIPEKVKPEVETPKDRAKAVEPKREGQKSELPDVKPEVSPGQRASESRPADESNLPVTSIEMPETRLHSDRRNQFYAVKTAFDAASEAKRAKEHKLAEEYRKEAMEAFRREKEKSDKAAVAALGISIAAPWVAAAGIAGAGAAASTTAGEAVIGFMAKRSVQWTFTGFGVATGVKSDEEADISPVLFDGLLRAVSPLVKSMFKGPGIYGRTAEEIAIAKSPQFAAEIPNPGSSLGRPTRGTLKNFERFVRQLGYDVRYVKSGPSHFKMEQNGRYIITLNEKTMTVGTLTDELSHAFAQKYGIGTFLPEAERVFLIQLKAEAKAAGGTANLSSEKELLLHMLELKNMISSGKNLPAFYTLIDQNEITQYLSHTPGGLTLSGTEITLPAK